MRQLKGRLKLMLLQLLTVTLLQPSWAGQEAVEDFSFSAGAGPWSRSQCAAQMQMWQSSWGVTAGAGGVPEERHTEHNRDWGRVQ